MALVDFVANPTCSCSVRKGDVIVHWRDPDGKSPFPFHVCIHIGAPQKVTGDRPRLRIRGLPACRYQPSTPDKEETFLGDAWTGDKGSWYANMVGQRFDVDVVQLQEVVLLSDAVQREHSQLPRRCEWHEKMVVNPLRLILGKHPLFISGTCAHFIEYLYEQVGLDLVVQERVQDPKEPNRLPPGAQVHAFYTGTYPLNCDWDERFRRYPDCVSFGVRSDEQ